MKANAPRLMDQRKKRLEKWVFQRQTNSRTKLSDWELDEAYLTLCMAFWPLDMEEARLDSYHAQTARQRLRLRYEGYCLLRDLRERVDSLAEAAAMARELFVEPKEQEVQAKSKSKSKSKSRVGDKVKRKKRRKRRSDE